MSKHKSIVVTEFTEEEKTELKTLRDEFRQERRQKRGEMFKALPASSRQVSVDIRKAHAASKEVEWMEVKRTERLKDLEKKEDLIYQVFGYNGTCKEEKASSCYHDPIFATFSCEELEKLHLDATAEEMLEEK